MRFLYCVFFKCSTLGFSVTPGWDAVYSLMGLMGEGTYLLLLFLVGVGVWKSMMDW